jgi:hypothetical protein
MFSKILAAEAAAFWNAGVHDRAELAGKDGMIPLASCGSLGFGLSMFES